MGHHCPGNRHCCLYWQESVTEPSLPWQQTLESKYRLELVSIYLSFFLSLINIFIYLSIYLFNLAALPPPILPKITSSSNMFTDQVVNKLLGCSTQKFLRGEDDFEKGTSCSTTEHQSRERGGRGKHSPSHSVWLSVRKKKQEALVFKTITDWNPNPNLVCPRYEKYKPY